MNHTFVGLYVAAGLSLFSLSTAQAADAGFTGHWKGQGLFQSAELNQPISTQLEIQLKMSASNLALDDCWTSPDSSGKIRRQCYHSDYALNESQQIFDHGKKVGDIFGDRIVIFNGNTQVSEQMIIELNEAHKLRYRYSFLTYDGEMTTRSGILSAN